MGIFRTKHERWTHPGYSAKGLAPSMGSFRHETYYEYRPWVLRLRRILKRDPK